MPEELETLDQVYVTTMLKRLHEELLCFLENSKQNHVHLVLMSETPKWKRSRTCLVGKCDEDVKFQELSYSSL